ncbi:protein tas-like isoform X2 [Rhodamnia argentea]|uniref:Protein tas-like isoform X2 n=1 Tax=Rhodamnia argentea TaxID=178133 RepID=A0A8B8PDP4_9MYRT|nr:protein tas-like isoform X2 [Rhodamnia argentea]
MAVPLFNLAPDLSVSRLCLGTMTFGEQNSMSESFRLLDHAFDAGINFFDSAEMYPVPQRADTQGRSEEHLGRWVRDRKIPRDRVVLATKESSIKFSMKVSGPSGQMTWIRDGPKCLDAWNISEAIDNSLLRLRTDYIDLFQIHWSDRYVPMFGKFEYDPTHQYSAITVEEQLEALGRAVSSGKIRYVGLSNETPYGVMKFLHVAKRVPSYPKVVSVQNCYSLLCRTFDSGMAECCHHERISLLAYSPLAMGILSGKYFLPDGGPLDARLNLFKGRYSEGESRYNLSNSIVTAAVMGYLKIADKYGLCPVALAIAFVLRHPLVASAIFGATKRWQLQEVLDACSVELSPEIVAEINQIHANYPNPCP